MVCVVDLGARIVRVRLLATVMCARQRRTVAVRGQRRLWVGQHVRRTGLQDPGARYLVRDRSAPFNTGFDRVGARNWKGWRFIFHSGPPEHYVASKGSKKVTFRLSDGESE